MKPKQGAERAVNLLFVEDDLTIRRATASALERVGFAVDSASDGEAGLDHFLNCPPDVALLDVVLPHMDGVALCHAIRSRSQLPVVMLSARSDAIDIVRGLEAGADDYVAKPFDLRVLIARLRVALRRASPMPRQGVIVIGALRLDLASGEVSRANSPVRLTATEHRLLMDLAEHVGQPRSRDALLRSVWGYTWDGDTRLVDVHVQRLRGKVGSDVIETIRGVGYRLTDR